MPPTPFQKMKVTACNWLRVAETVEVSCSNCLTETGSPRAGCQGHVQLAFEALEGNLYCSVCKKQ